ncbi:MAG: 50S ribosomal protein L29 [Planctomycetota bacterium]|nr:50S ribosomal protein L29 [Planctomycetota bacterium]
MPIVKAVDLREKTDQELLDQFALERKRIFDATVRGASGEAIKPHEKREGRRLLARIKTVLRERGLRVALDKRIAGLQGQTAGAQTEARKLAEADPRPRRPRAKGQRLGIETSARGAAGLPKEKRVELERRVAANRAALNLAEARRLRKGLERADAGQGK